jgi:FMN reductase
LASLTAVAVSGSPRSPSKSKALAEYALRALERHDCDSTLIDLSALSADALVARTEDPQVEMAVEAVGHADIIVAATPTYRAVYTGLLKCFFDLMPQAHLAGKICLALQTAAVPHHALGVDYGLRPLFMSLEGVPVAGVFATDEEFIDGAPNDALVTRVDEASALAAGLAKER